MKPKIGVPQLWLDENTGDLGIIYPDGSVDLGLDYSHFSLKKQEKFYSSKKYWHYVKSNETQALKIKRAINLKLTFISNIE